MSQYLKKKTTALMHLETDEFKPIEINEEHYKKLPNTDFIMNRTFWIGVWPGITEGQIEYILDVIKKWCKGHVK